MPGYFRIIPEYIASDKSLSSSEKLFYALLEALMSKYGFCWAYNTQLAEYSGHNVRTVQRYITKLIKSGHIIVEIELNQHRKIWTKLTWNNREESLKRYEDDIKRHPEFNQRFTTYDRIVMGGMTDLSPSPTPPNKDDIRELNKRNKTQRGADAPSIDQKPVKTPTKVGNSRPRDWQPPDKQSPGVRQLPRSMTKGSPPTPGPKQMVEESEKILKSPIQIGSQKYYLHPLDRPWFYGFSPYVIEQGILRVNKLSLSGQKIRDITAKLFFECSEYRREADG